MLSFNVYAKDDFNVVSQCSDEYEYHCDVYLFKNGKKDKILEDLKSPVVNEINSDLFSIKTSCGSPCQVYWFFSSEKKDLTNEFIAIDSKRNCLIESNSSKKLIYARKIFSNNKKIIVNLKEKDFKKLKSSFDYYTYFKRNSYFDSDGVLNLISIDYSGREIKRKIESPCGKDN